MSEEGRRILFYLFSCFFGYLARPAPGKPLQSETQVFAFAGKDVILPCHLAASIDPSHVMAVEWSRVDGHSPLIVHVLRDGKDLVKEKAAEYLNRTSMIRDGSLKLDGVRHQDSGRYRCVRLSGSFVTEEAFVYLMIAHMSEVQLSVQRTPANKLIVLCESSGWNPRPLVSLLDSKRTGILAARTMISVQPDNLYSVRTWSGVAAEEATLTGSQMFICRVELPQLNAANEARISITDEFDPLQAQNGCGIVWFAASVVIAPLLCVLLVVIFVFPLWKVEELRNSMLHLRAFSGRGDPPEEGEGGNQKYTEYGDINKIETNGASENTARINTVDCKGIKASNKLAERDLEEMLRYREIIVSVGKKLDVPPALIAAIISRQSQAGTSLRPDGFGKTDPNCFGLMQISKYHHAVKGNGYSKDHVDQGVTFLVQLIKTMRRTKPEWSKEQQLKGALACYMVGEEKVIPLAYEELDSVTPHQDFCSDVVARAQWFATNHF